MENGNGYIGSTDSQRNGCNNPRVNGKKCVSEENGNGVAIGENGNGVALGEKGNRVVLGENGNGAVVDKESDEESKTYLKSIFTTLMTASQDAVSNAIQKLKSRLVAENKVKEIS